MRVLLPAICLLALIPGFSHRALAAEARANVFPRSLEPTGAKAKQAAAANGNPEDKALLAACRADFDAWCDRCEKDLADRLPDARAARRSAFGPQTTAALVRWKLLSLCDRDALFEVLKRPGGYACFRDFFGNPEWMEETLVMAGIKAPGVNEMHSGWNAGCMDKLRLIHRNCKGLDRPLYRRLASVLAARGTNDPWYLIDTYNFTQEAHQAGRLHGGFDHLSAREMQWAVNRRTGGYYTGGAHEEQSSLDYTLDWGDSKMSNQFNSFGMSYSCSGRGPLYAHVYGWNTPRYWQLHGGVCGPMSSTACVAVRTHGIPCLNAFQPQHFCFLVRQGDSWNVGFNTFGNNSTFSGGNGGGEFIFYNARWDTNFLYEAVHNDAAAFRRATRLTWAAHWLRAREAAQLAARETAVKGPKKVQSKRSDVPDWLSVYTAAVAAQPKNADTWEDLFRHANAIPAIPASTWSAWAKAATDGFTAKPEISCQYRQGWPIVLNCLTRAAEDRTDEQKAAAFLAVHRVFHETGDLNQQANFIKDPAQQVRFFGDLLGIYGADGKVLNWGFNRFSIKPDTANDYARVMEKFFAGLGADANKNTVAWTVSSGIRKASESGDKTAFDTWNALADKLLPAAVAGDIHLKPQQLADWPGITPFPGRNLSQEALLQTSSACTHDRPRSYKDILSDKIPGYFDTNAEKKPWAQVVFGGENELSGIVLVPRSDHAPEVEWDVPLIVSISIDGKTWTQVARFDKAEPIYRVDLGEQKPHAKFVRIEREPEPETPGAAPKQPGRFHFRNFVVYGRRLY